MKTGWTKSAIWERNVGSDGLPGRQRFRKKVATRGSWRIEGLIKTKASRDMPNTTHRSSSDEGGSLLAVATRGWPLMDNKTVLAAGD